MCLSLAIYNLIRIHHSGCDSNYSMNATSCKTRHSFVNINFNLSLHAKTVKFSHVYKICILGFEVSCLNKEGNADVF